MSFVIIGAGLAGLFAAAALRDEAAHIYEKQASIPNNHSALLRFRSSIVGDTLNIPFEQVIVIKTVLSTGNPIRDAVMYSIKTNGHARMRSILSANGLVEKRYIAPDNFISLLYNKVSCSINFNHNWDVANRTGPVISTMPMPILMNALGYEHDCKFESVTGITLRVKLRDCDFCGTIYYPGDEPQYRASVTKDELIIEYAIPNKAHPEIIDKAVDGLTKRASTMADEVLHDFGISSRMIASEPVVKRQMYAKILPIDDNERKRFILWASEKHGIYSFGRFATWRPGLLMDDLVNDLRTIQRLASGETTYNARKVKKEN